jgi:predicted RNase H-like HicB family nuclease
LRQELHMKIKVVLYPSDEGFAVSAPSLPGCWSQGASQEEALANIADAIREYLDAEVKQPDGAEVREIEVAV